MNHAWRVTETGPGNSWGIIRCERCALELGVGHDYPMLYQQLKDLGAEDCDTYILIGVLES